MNMDKQTKEALTKAREVLRGLSFKDAAITSALEAIARTLDTTRASHGQAPAQAAPAYKDCTPELHVGDSAFESWYSNYNPAHKADKQRARDAYAAGMGDPLVTAAPAAVAGCTRSHPHENMDSACQAKAAIAEMQNMAARGAEATANDLERFVAMLAAAPTTQQTPQQEQAAVPRFNCWSTNDGDSWFDHPADSQAIYDCLGNDAKVGDEYELTAGWRSVTARYRITEVVGDGEEYEVECISHQQENTAPQPAPASQGDALDAARRADRKGGLQ